MAPTSTFPLLSAIRRIYLSLLIFLLMTAGAWAATFTVSNNNDAGPGSFRQALIDANNNVAAGPHTIVFTIPAGEVIALLTGLPAVNTNVTILGPDDKIIIRRSSAASAEFRLFQISGNRTVVMKNLVLESGAPASGQAGGGLYVQGNLTLENCSIQNCKTYGSSGAHGGAIWNESSLTLRNCQLTNNASSGTGGAIIVRSNARFYMANSVVENNTAASNGGGITHDANNTTYTNTIINSFIRNNTSTSGNGGGVNNNGKLEIINTLVSQNKCGSRGGGIGNEGSNNVNLLVQGSTISNNTSVSNGGGINFYTSTGSFAISNSTISNNNCTGAGATGGGVQAQAGSGFISYSTIVLNNTPGNGGGLRLANGTNELNYCIIAGNNTANADARGRDLDGNRFSTFGRNLIGTAGNAPYGSWTIGSVTTGNNTANLAVTDIINTTLADNGGPLPTHALVNGSFAINPSQPAGLSSPFDQRGFPRVGNVDIGATEWGSTAPFVTTGVATNLRAASVVLNGTANTSGLPVTFYFDYGPSAAYGQKSPVQVTTGGAVAIQTGGLQPSVTYQYRAVATYGSSNEFILAGSNNNFTMPAYSAPPVLTMATGNLFLYTASADRINIDGSLMLSDEDNTTLAGALVQIAANYVAGEDEILYSPQNGINASWNAGTGTLAFTGSATLATYQALLRSVQYKNNLGTAANYQQRTLTVTIDDGLNDVSGSRNIVLALSENSPLLVASSNTAFVYTEATGYKTIPAALTVSSPTAATLQSATVAITGKYQPAEDELFFTTQNGISGVWNSGTGVLQLSGSATFEQYQTALNSVQYRNTSRNPDVQNRTVTYTVNDGTYDSNPFAKQVTVQAVNDAPELSNIETTTLNHTENSTPLAVTASLVLFDADNTNLTGATVRITGNYKRGQDVLSFKSGNGISGTWADAAGILTLSGSATVAQYQTAIRSITYHQLTNYEWSGLERTVSITLTDGSANSNSVTRTITPQQKQMMTFNYAEGLQKSLYFLEAQRSGVLPTERGKLPGQNRVEWRGNSLLTDGSDVGLDLTGGWYDAGDTYKCNSTMAYAASMLAWSGVEYPQAFNQTGQNAYLLDNLKFVNDYFIKCFVNDQPGQYQYYTQVTSGTLAHNHWASPEVLDNLTAYLGVNPTYRIDVGCKGSDVAGQTAAAMASSSIVFRQAGQIAYADLLLEKARRMFDFGDTYRGVDGHRNKDGVISKNQNYFYRDDNYWDEMMWAAIWLHKAEEAAATSGYTGAYLAKANEYYSLQPNPDNVFAHFRELSFNTVDKAAFILLVKATSGAQQATYRQRVENWLDWWTIGYTDKARYTPGGMACKTSQNTINYAPLRYSTNQAFAAGIYSDWMADGVGVNGAGAPLANPSALTSVDRKAIYGQFAERQVAYALGDNPYNRSFVVGYGPNPWNAPHHRAAYGPWAGFEHLISGKPQFNLTNSRHTIYGALLGGPGKTDGASNPLDEFDLSVNNVTNSVTNEVALDFNAGLPGLMARLHLKYPNSGNVLPDFPAAETKDDEFFVEASLTGSSSNSASVKLQINNRSSWPARSSDKLSARYYVRLEDGISPASVTVTAQAPVANTNSFGGTVSGLKHFGGNMYYVDIDFTGWVIYPGGLVPTTNSTDNVLWMREAAFTITGPSGWSNDNDWSFNGLAPLSTGAVAKTRQIPVYEDGKLLFGEAPLIQTQSITFAPISNKVYGAEPVALQATASSNLPVTYTVTGPASVTNNQLAISGVGTVTVTAVQAGDDHYEPAPDVEQTFDITPKALVIKAADQTKECGEALTLGSTAFEAVGLVYSDVVSSVTLSSTGSPANATVGNYPVVPSAAQGSNGLTHNYTIEYQNGTLKVQDKTAPVADVAELPTLTGSCSVTVATKPTATDGCAGKLEGATTDPLIYTRQGEYTITWTFDDGQGNSLIQTQVVKVKDNTPPSITAPPALNLAASSGACHAVNVALGTAQTSDNCAVQSVSNNAPATFPVGTTTVTWTVTDVNGLQATATQLVTVTDNQQPVVVLVSNPTVTLVNGSYTLKESDVIMSKNDNCGIFKTTVPATVFSCANNGSNNPVSISVEDVHGNVFSTTVSVKVIGNNPSPTITVSRSDNTYTGNNTQHTVYIGYGAQELTLSASGNNGAVNSFRWSPASGLSAINTANPVFSPTAAGNYTFTVTVTSPQGCAATASATITVIDVRCDKNKVVMCDPKKGTQCVSSGSVDKNLKAGWTLGACPLNGATTRIQANEKGGDLLEQGLPEIQVFPNPATAVVNVLLNCRSAAKYRFSLLSASAQRVMVFERNLGKGPNNVPFNVGHLSAGLYLLQVAGDEVVRTIRIVLVK